MNDVYEEDLGLPQPIRRIFCNRTLNLRSIRAVGFDMDYTLIHYDADEWEREAYAHLRSRLEARGWPVDGLDFDPKLVTHGDFTDEIGFHFARAALEQRPRPTAFVAGSMMTALGVYRAARTSNLVIGQDISVIAHDDVFPYLTAENMTPSLSTTRSSIRAAGSRITNLLLQILAGREATDVSELWPVELILRETSRPVSKEQST